MTKVVRQAKQGRPKAIIDWRIVDQMLMAQIDGSDIADAMGIHPDTLYAACERDHNSLFSAYAQSKRASGVVHAKQTFYKQAWIDTNADNQTTKQIFWLKNYGNMADKPSQQTNITLNVVNLLEIPDDGTDKQQTTVNIQAQPWKAIPSPGK